MYNIFIYIIIEIIESIHTGSFEEMTNRRIIK
jgi:hypothetical protein